MKTEPIRIAIADSRDLAYEYSKAAMDFDTKSGGHRSTENGNVRVWQKRGGEWKVAAFFGFRYDEP